MHIPSIMVVTAGMLMAFSDTYMGLAISVCIFAARFLCPVFVK
jgi:hypothetical protein